MLDLLTTPVYVFILSNLKAELLFKERVGQTENSFAELVLWRVPVIVEGSRHPFKYRLAYVVDGQCVYGMTMNLVKAIINLLAFSKTTTCLRHPLIVG